MTLARIRLGLAWLAAAWIAFEFIWYQQYKLTGPTLVFERLSEWSGIPEMPFRLFVAGMEIVATVLVLIPRTQAFGGLFTMGIMVGAIFFHLFTPLGVDPYEDGARLFKEACFTLAMGAVIVFARWPEVLALGAKLPVVRRILGPLRPHSA
ncbi:MAG: DoxX family protein [Roseomonas sp.]|nr:DoxX family protein [Roseomonas sp.]MCA3378970.1 DoxX family protein [Roseomonas sp.]